MNHNLRKFVGVILCGIMVLSIVTALFHFSRGKSMQQEVEDTHRALRERGFKNDLADFNFHTDSAMQSREMALTFSGFIAQPATVTDMIDLLPIVADDSAIVVWKQDWLMSDRDQVKWSDLHEALEEIRPQLDAACDAALSGPIQFNLEASRGNAMLLRHLADIKKLALKLGARTVLNLHDGNNAAAFTNLLAQSRLITAWEPEPSEISHLVRFGCVTIAFDSVWQALQTNGWSDEQLARLQQEWMAVDYFKKLSDTMAFKRACVVADCKRERNEPFTTGISASAFFKKVTHSPTAAFAELKSAWSRARYHSYGTYVDEKALLLFYRDREVELHNAVQAGTWSAMRPLPGVTNVSLFQSPYRSRLASMMNIRETGLAFQRQGGSLLARAAKAEAQRRILLAAIALERFRARHGDYPQTVAELAPEFLPAVPMDFMDGQPLRYRLTPDGHFLLYSVGLDCLNNGGILRTRKQRIEVVNDSYLAAITPQADILWPLPAGSNALQKLQEQQVRDEQAQIYSEQQRESAEDWKQSPLRQARVAQILATKSSPVLDPGFFGGHTAAEALHNTNSAIESITLAELMTPRQIFTGHEPEELTFQFPVSYDVIGEHGFFLLLDADTNSEAMFAPDSGAKVQERSRAANGDCLLVWHTIFDPPGQHALQVELTWDNASGAETWCRGPAISIVTTNFCQFSYDSSTYDAELGARFHARLPEANGLYSIECLTTNGAHLATLTGSTSNGEFNVVWNLVDDHGHRLTGETFNSVVHITLPDSGRTQTMKGP